MTPRSLAVTPWPMAWAVAWTLASLMVGTAAVAQTAKATPASTSLDTRLAQAMADPKQAEALLKTGRKVAAVCANCHGDNGNSSKPDVPNLAGQNTAYLMEQLARFADGRRRNEFMQGMIRALSPDEKVGAVMFFAAQSVTPKPPQRADLRAQGADIYQKNCFRCHGNQGMGNEKIARIAGQQPEYLTLSIKRYRSGTDVRFDPLMASATKLLTDTQVDAVAAFVSTLP